MQEDKIILKNWYCQETDEECENCSGFVDILQRNGKYFFRCIKTTEPIELMDFQIKSLKKLINKKKLTKEDIDIIHELTIANLT